MSVAQDILLSHISCGTVEVESAAANLEAIHGAKIRRSKSIDGVIGKARKDQIAVIELVIYSSSVGVVVLYFVRADCEIWRAGSSPGVRRRRKQLQIG